jgi:hypothetical protein
VNEIIRGLQPELAQVGPSRNRLGFR